MGEYYVQRKDVVQNNRSSNSNNRTVQVRQNGMAGIIQMVKINPKMLTQNDVMVLQRAIGNQAVCQMLSSDREDKNQEPNQIQGNNNIFQRREITKEKEPVQRKEENKTGIPDNLKIAVENKSGISMDDVKVNYNSDKPKQLGALAYTQGTEIHVGPGQEKYLGHELGHVVQQKQGRVRPTTKVNGVNVNDDVRLEKEADAIQMKSNENFNNIVFQFKLPNLIQTGANCGMFALAMAIKDLKGYKKGDSESDATADGNKVAEDLEATAIEKK